VLRHDADAVPDHEPAGGFLGDRSREGGAGQLSERQIASVSYWSPSNHSSTLKLKPGSQ
jgi:hypothetical protein